MDQKKCFTALALGLIVLVTVGTASGQSRIPGVSTGNWFKYDCWVNWSSSDPNATYPMDFKKLNDTEWFRLDVTGVVGNNVYIDTIFHLKNEIEETHSGSVNIETGEQTGDTYMSGLVVGALLNVNDTIYSSMSTPMNINKTIMRTYLAESRETNFAFYNNTNAMGYLYMYAEIYYDRTTGSFVELYYESPHNYDEELSYGLKIIESNVWIVPEISSFHIPLIFMIATLIAVIVYKRIGHNRKLGR